MSDNSRTILFNCNPFNLDGIHSQMEMLLSALFDGSYSLTEKTLLAENGSIEYRYTKGPLGNSMSVRVISLNRPRKVFVVRYEDRVFPINLLKHPLLNLNQCIQGKVLPKVIIEHAERLK